MARPATWVTSLTIGLALACNGRSATADDVQSQDKPAPLAPLVGEAVKGATLVDHLVVPAHSINTNAGDDETTTDGFAVGRNRVVSENAELPVSELIKERYTNGAVKVERRVTQDAQGNYLNHGAFKMWDQRGGPVAQGTYDFANRTGTWTRWYRSGAEAELLTKLPYNQFTEPFISQATFKHDQLDGMWTIYDAKMRKISQIHFADGKRQGVATWWYVSGRKMREAEYKDGDLDGTLVEFGPEGKTTLKETYQGGHKLANKVANHPGAGKKSEATYLFPKEIEQTPDDWWNCKLATTTKTGKEEKHGPWTSWYSNGQMQLEGAYEHDVQVGKFVWWHANGQKAQEGRFDHGKQDGTWTWWYPSGQKSIFGEYAKGNPTGKWTWWKEDGHVVQAADLSHAEGIVIDMPVDANGHPLPHNKTEDANNMATPLNQPLKR